MLTELVILIEGETEFEDMETDIISSAVSNLEYDGFNVISATTKEVNNG